MKRKMVFALWMALLAAGSIGKMEAQTEIKDKEPTLSVSGQGEAKARPDTAYLSLGVVNRGKTAKEAVRANADAATQLIAAIKKAGIAEKDIQTSDYSVMPLYSERRVNQVGQELEAPKIIGYQVSNNVRAVIRKIEDVGKVIDMAADAGGNQIQGVSFGLEKRDAFQAQALRDAVADARRQADIVAAAAGCTIVGVKEINIGGGYRPMPLMDMSFARSAAATPIQPGELTVSATVSITYTIRKTG